MIEGVIHTKEDLAGMIRAVGILPFFTNSVRGWSVEEHIDPSVWFTDADGPWEWKGPLAADKTCVYGKFIRNKAAFISPEWFPDLANWRRDGYEWDSMVDEGIVPYKERLLMAYLEEHPHVLSKYAKRECGFTKGFDAVLTRLQMQTFVVTSDFRYCLTKEGVPYGWGNAEISIADKWLGVEITRVPEDREPEASFERMISHLMKVMPEADETILRKELR